MVIKFLKQASNQISDWLIKYLSDYYDIEEDDCEIIRQAFDNRMEDMVETAEVVLLLDELIDKHMRESRYRDESNCPQDEQQRKEKSHI